MKRFNLKSLDARIHVKQENLHISWLHLYLRSRVLNMSPVKRSDITCFGSLHEL